MGKSTISMAIFNSKLLVYQRVNPIGSHAIPFFFSVDVLRTGAADVAGNRPEGRGGKMSRRV